MSTIPKLALFDIDGTIAIHRKIPPEIFAGFAHLQQQGCITSLSTGRGYVRLKQVLGEAFETLISPEAPIIVEHGTKIVSRDGQVLFADYLSNTEIEHAVDFIRANIGLFNFAWFNPSDIKLPVQMWSAEDASVAAEQARRGDYVMVFHAPLAELRRRLLAQPPTCISLSLKDHVKVENLKLAFTRTNTNVIFQDGNMEFVRANTNKGLAVLYAARQLNINVQDILLAGNAINDVEMLDLDVGQAILVGPSEDRAVIQSYLSAPDTLVHIDNPKELGSYLARL